MFSAWFMTVIIIVPGVGVESREVSGFTTKSACDNVANTIKEDVRRQSGNISIQAIISCYSKLDPGLKQ
jgi:hypothetical protein